MQLPQRSRILLFYLFATVALALIQVSLPDRMLGILVKPDLMLVLVILSGFLYGPFEGALVGIVTGFLRDAFAGGSIGVGMLLCMYAGLFSGLIFQKMFRKGWFAGILQVLLVSTLFYVFVDGLDLLLQPQDASYPFIEWARLIFTAKLPILLLLNFIAAFPLLLVLRIAGPRRRKGSVLGGGEVERDLWQRQ